MTSTKSTLIAVDGSKCADNTFHEYLRHVHRDGDRVILGHVSESIHAHYAFRPGMGVSEEAWNQMLKANQQRVDDIQLKYTKQLRDRKIEHTFITEHGEPGFRICLIATKHAANLIMAGTRGHGTVRRTVLGSVSDYLLHHAPVPVMICHLPVEEQE